ncbi:FG-GAP repeat domain-containing protein [Streptomyces sp. NPDC056463]|uniref:FG-GAP repeat domain-containing protein n=1 Tax=Streptomyces sp. NPDC056463 TaxID=3345827 RepID=UPI00368CD26C
MHPILGFDARRLAIATLTLAGVAGTLVTVPATAAVAAPVAPAWATAGASATADASDIVLPSDAEVVSAGTTGFLTARPDGAGGSTLTWTKYADGSTTTVQGTRAYTTSSDSVVTHIDDGRIAVRDMTVNGSFFASYNLPALLGNGSKVVGAVGDALYVAAPTRTGYYDLYQLTQQNGATSKRKISYGYTNTGYKVIGRPGSDPLILGTHDQNGETVHWYTTWKGGEIYYYIQLTGSRNANETGAISPHHIAWTEHPGNGTEIVVDDVRNYDPETRIPLGSGQTAVVAGLVGDWVTYGQTDGATATAPNALHALTARSLTGGGTVRLLDHMSSSAVAPDGSLLVRGGTVAQGEGLYRISDGGGTPVVTLVAPTGRPTSVAFTGSSVPEVMDLDKNGGSALLEWTLSRSNVRLDVTLQHKVTGKKFSFRESLPQSPARFTWNGTVDSGESAPNGDYVWNAVATPLNGIGEPAYVSGSFKVTRTANPHDYTDNGSTDVLARDASGTLWRDDTFDWPVAGALTPAKRAKIGTGWNTYSLIEAAGNIGGAPAGDLVARDTAGVLWHYLGKGDGTFTARTKIGAGWGVYNKIAAGSDLNGDGRSDLLATDTAGVLWFYKGTGSTSAPFGARVKVGGGWGIYNQITATGNIAGGAAGDLVARDTAGVLWLYQGKGDGTFAGRVRVGGGWGAFTQLVGLGDTNNDGRPDLLGYGAGGTYVYLGTGSATAPFTRTNTSLYQGEGTKFTSVS